MPNNFSQRLKILLKEDQYVGSWNAPLVSCIEYHTPVTDSTESVTVVTN
jgi:hypothetical protein